MNHRLWGRCWCINTIHKSTSKIGFKCDFKHLCSILFHRIRLDWYLSHSQPIWSYTQSVHLGLFHSNGGRLAKFIFSYRNLTSELIHTCTNESLSVRKITNWTLRQTGGVPPIWRQTGEKFVLSYHSLTVRLYKWVTLIRWATFPTHTLSLLHDSSGRLMALSFPRYYLSKYFMLVQMSIGSFPKALLEMNNIT